MKQLKTKLITIIACTFNIIGFAQTPYISGQYDVCTNPITTQCFDAGYSSYNYVLNNVTIPQTATNIDIGWEINTLDGDICSTNNVYNSLSAYVMFYEHSCNANASILINYVSYDDASGITHTQSFNPAISKSIHDLTMEPIGNITGLTSIFACNTNQTQYSIDPVCGATYYEWTISGIGWTAASSLAGNNLTTITLNPSQSSNCQITVTAWLDAAKTCAYSKTTSINVERPVEPPVFVTAPLTLCLSSNPSYNVIINPVANSSGYTWSCSSPWTITGIRNQYAKILTFNSTTSQNGQICVSNNATCGGTSAPTCLNVTVLGNTLPTPVFGTPHKSSICIGEDVGWNVIPVPFATSYNWWRSSGTSVMLTTDGSNSASLAGSSYGLATTIKVTAVNNCATSVARAGVCGVHTLNCGPLRLKSNSEDIVIEENNAFSIYPNPANNNLNITYFSQENSVMNIVITDVLGNIVLKEVKDLSEGNNELKLQLDGITNGIYFVNLDGKDFSNKKKIVIEK